MLRFALCVVSLMALARAQSTSASVSGRVADPSNALIVNAVVAAINADTNVRYATATNASGEYRLANLPPGRYRIEIQKPGFKTLIKPDVILHVQDALNIDLEMALGGRSEIVTVEAGAPVVNTESGSVSTVVDRAFVENLPLNGRSFQNLIMLTPGVVLTPTAFDDQGQFGVNGQRADANYFTIDGVSANFGVTGYPVLAQTASGALPALTASGGTNSLVSMDAMQEFRIQTSSFAPEFGRTPGGQISVVTRSGTNAFHGTLSEYFRNSALDAADWFVNFNRLLKPKERLNDFGGVFGGPVVKERTFFFFSYEGLRLRLPALQQTVVPDSASRLQAPAAMRPYLNVYPVPNGPALAAGLAQFSASYSNPSSLNAYSLRIDQVLNSRLNFFARYNYSPSKLVQRASIASVPVLSMTQSVSSTVQTLTTGFTQLITSAVSNELRANYSNHRMDLKYNMDTFGGAVPIPDSLLFPNGYSSANGIFFMYITGTGQVSQGKLGIDEQRQVNVIDNASVTRGAHQLKFGMDYRWLSPFSSPFSYRQSILFSGVNNAPGGALSGTAANAQAGAYQPNILLSRNFSFYGQDTWKVTPRVTLTYGLRWDINPPLKGRNAANDPFTVTGLDNPATIALAARGTPLYGTTYANVAPRLGLGWQLRGGQNRGLTMRAGFGVFYDLGQGSLGATTSYFPYFTNRTIPVTPTPFPLSPQDATPPPFTLDPPVSNIIVADPHLKLPRSYQWNVAFEQSLGNSQSISMTYIAAIGRDLLRVTNLINVNPDFQAVSLTDNTSTSDYHGLQLRFQRRFAQGLQAIASYSFSHSIDTASSDSFAHYLSTPGANRARLDRGDSDFDIRHSFTTGVTYDLPAARQHRLVRTMVGGWSLNGFVLARSAPPVNVIGARFQGAGITFYPRPHALPGVPLELFGSGYPGGKIFNAAAFISAPAGQHGSFGRNVLRGFGAAQADLGLQRHFRMTEKLGLRFRAEFFNILNHPNFGNPMNNLTSPLFGRSTQTLANSLGSGGANGGFNPLYQVGGPRSIQLALKFQF